MRRHGLGLLLIFCQAAEQNLKRAGPCPFAIGSQFGADQAQMVRDRHSTKFIRPWSLPYGKLGSSASVARPDGRQDHGRGLTLSLEPVS